MHLNGDYAEKNRIAFRVDFIMKSQRIIMVVSHFRPPITGGEIYNDKLYSYLTSIFSQVGVISLYNTPFRFGCGFVLRNLWFLKLLKYRHENTIILEDAVRSSDLILFNVFTHIADRVLTKNMKTIPIVHLIYYPLEKNRFRRCVKFIHEYIFLSYSNKIIVNSEFTKGDVLKILKQNDKKILIAHPGLNILPNKYNIKIDGNMDLLFVGSVTQRKDIATLIKAFEILINKNGIKNLHLHIVGDQEKEKDYTNKLKNFCRDSNLNNSIQFYGRIDDDKLADLYSLSDIFVFPSLWEGFGMVLVEAMSFQLPIVATNVGAIPFLVKDGVNGYLVPPKDHEKLAESIKKLIDNPKDREKMGELNLKVSNEFDWDTTLKKIGAYIV